MYLNCLRLLSKSHDPIRTTREALAAKLRKQHCQHGPQVVAQQVIGHAPACKISVLGQCLHALHAGRIREATSTAHSVLNADAPACCKGCISITKSSALCEQHGSGLIALASHIKPSLKTVLGCA